jgi:hypothetical protein
MEKELNLMIINSLNNKLDDLFVEGLKRKGFEFSNKIELMEFIKSNCRCEDNIVLQQRTYFVNDIPFFLHCYEFIFEPITEDNNGIKMNANYGRYVYL